MIRVYSNPRKPSQTEYHHCLRKRKYTTVDEAAEAAKRMGKKFKKHFAVYKCWYCREWHVGTDRTKTFKYLTRKGIWGKQPPKTKK